MKLEEVILRDTRANQPAAGDVPAGTLYFVTDESVTERSDGSSWQSYSDTGGGGSYAALIHATTHSDGGSDPIDVTNLDGFPGGTSTFLRADGTFAAPSAATITRQVTLIIDGGGTVITTGVKGYISIPSSGTFTKWRLLSVDTAGPATAGSIVIDIWKDTYTNYPPTVADTITAAAKPTLSAVNKNEDSSLTGWTTSFAAGDILGFNVDSVSGLTKVSLTLEFN